MKAIALNLAALLLLPPTLAAQNVSTANMTSYFNQFMEYQSGSFTQSTPSTTSGLSSRAAGIVKKILGQR